MRELSQISNARLIQHESISFAIPYNDVVRNRLILFRKLLELPAYDVDVDYIFQQQALDPQI